MYSLVPKRYGAVWLLVLYRAKFEVTRMSEGIRVDSRSCAVPGLFMDTAVSRLAIDTTALSHLSPKISKIHLRDLSPKGISILQEIYCQPKPELKASASY